MFLGCDGWIRVWDLESIFNAKATDTEDVDKTIFRLDPMNEVQVEVGAVLKSIVRSKRQLEDHNDWFLQVIQLDCDILESYEIILLKLQPFSRT